MKVNMKKKLKLHSPWLVDHMYEVSHRSVKRFWRKRFFDVFIFNPIWLPDHMTNDIINLIFHSKWVVCLIYEVSDFLEKDFNSTNYSWNTTSPIMSSLSLYILHWELMTCKVSIFFFIERFWIRCPIFFPLTQYGCHTMWSMTSELLIKYSPRGVRAVFKVSHRSDKRLQRKK